jgi:hypothetical protein
MGQKEIRAVASKEKVVTDFDDTVSFAEAAERFAEIIDVRIRDLPRDEQLRIGHSERRDPRFEPIDATWLRLFVAVDDGVVELGVSPGRRSGKNRRRCRDLRCPRGPADGG